MPFPLALAWLFVGAFVLVLFIGTHSFFRGFDSPYLINADLFLYFGTLILAVSALLYRGLALFRFASRSVLTPCFVVVLLVQIASAICHQPATAIQSLTTEMAYPIWIVLALTLWQTKSQKPLVTLIGCSLIYVLTFVLFKWLQFMMLHFPSNFDFSRFLELTGKATIWASQRHPFYNPNFMAAYTGPLVVGVWAAWAFRFLPIPSWVIFLTIPMMCFASISKAMALILFGALILIGLSAPQKRKIFLSGALSYLLLAAVVFPPFAIVLMAESVLLMGVRYLIVKRRHIILWSLLSLSLISGITLFSKNFFSDSLSGNTPRIEKFVYDTSAGSRLLIWEGVWRAVIEGQEELLSPFEKSGNGSPSFQKWSHRLLGFGPGFYVFKSSLFREPGYYSGEYVSDYTIHPHNSFFSFLADTGLIGLGAWSLLFYQLFSLLFRLNRLEGIRGIQARVLLSLALALAAHSLFSSVTAYPIHKLLWVLVFSGAISLELQNRQFSFLDERPWPREFAGPFHAIAVGLIVLFCFKGFQVLSERWSLLKKMDATLGRVAAWRKHEDQHRGQPPDHALTIREFDDVMRQTEANFFGQEGRHWVNVNVIKTLKLLALTRENYLTWAQSRAPDDRFLVSRWRAQTFINLERALWWAPGFTDLARLYGEILWKVSKEYELSGISSFRFRGGSYSVPQAQSEAAQWTRYSIEKGTRDYYLFNTFLNRKTFEGLRQVVSNSLLKHPIFHPAFRRRLLEGARLKSSLVKSWIRWHIYFGSLGDRGDVMMAIERYVTSEKEDKRHGLVHAFAVDLLRQQKSVPFDVMDILKLGGRSSKKDQDYYLSLKPPSFGWVVENLRICLFEGAPVALERIREEIKKDPEKEVYRALEKFIVSYALQSHQKPKS